MKGLKFLKTADAIAAFVKQHGAAGPRRAILCTYDLLPTRFEAVVLPELTRRRKWFRTLVLADAAALQKDAVLSQRGAASAYELAPVRLKGPGVFHPKLIVLQAGERVLVGIGSGNLTPGGLGGNLELMLFASNESADGRALAGSAIQFLSDLREARGVVVPQSAKRFLERICLSLSRSPGGPVLHNLDKPLIAQLEEGRPRQIQRSAVMSPWHSSSASPEGVEPSVLKALGRAFGARPVVHTEGENGKGPGLGKNVHVRILKPNTPDPAEDVDADASDAEDGAPLVRRPTRLHAKAYLAVGKRGATLWFGSANCTTPALLRSASGGGNVELLVRAALGRSGVAAFEADLASRFDDSKGVLFVEPKERIRAPRGCILSGYASRWGDQPSMTLELAGHSPAGRILRVARSAKKAGTIAVTVRSGASSVVLDAKVIAKLLGGLEAPPVLWEHVGTAAIPFPVSVPCVPVLDEPEKAMDDLLDDLAGRAPATFSSARRRKRSDGPDMLDDPGDDEQDRELELLTKTKHEGGLDRVAVRVELLRRRLEAAAWSSTETRAYYRGVIGKLNLAPSLRRILADHLGAARSAR